MTLAVIATIEVQEGKNAEFESIFRELTEQVLTNEAGCTLYALNRSQSNPQVYRVLEQYKSQEDLQAHGQTEYFKAAGPKLAGVLKGAPTIEVLDSV